MPQPPLRDIDAPEDEPIRPSRPSLPSAVQDVLRRALEHKPPTEPVRDLVATKPDAPDEMPPETAHRRVKIELGSTRPRWAVVRRTRRLILRANANAVQLWCDEEDKSRATRGMLCEELALGAAERTTIQ